MTSPCRHLLLWAMLASLSISSTAYADWPQFRGPNAQGHSDAENTPIEWSANENVVWKQAIPGKGWSSPVLKDGKIYLTTAVPVGQGPKADQSLRALCLDSSTGTIIWDTEVFHQDGETAPRIHAKNSHASATPLIDGDKLYVHFGHQGLACLKAADGKTVWKNQDFPYKPVHGNGGSPVLYKEKLIVCMDGPDRREVVAFDKQSGKAVWQFKRNQPARKPFSFGTPLIITIAGKDMVVAPGSDVVNGLDPNTGNELWAVTYDGYSLVPRPVFAHGLIYLSTGYDTPKLLAIEVKPQGESYTAKVAWETRQDAPHNPSPLVIGDELYLVSDKGIASCLDAKTGKTYWRERVPGQYSSSPLVADGKIYLQTEDGTGVVLAVGTTFDILSTNKLGERSLASYAVDGNALLVRTESSLFKIAEK